MDLLSFLLLLSILLTATATANAQSALCRSTCGDINISYPFGIDDGCGSPRYSNLLSCPPSRRLLLLRTPSGSYPVRSLSYSDPHLTVSDPSMLSCTHPNVLATQTYSPVSPTFSLDSGTPLSLSPKNDFLFFNCSPSSVIVGPKPAFCARFPDRCRGSACDSAGYLCRNLPGCPDLGGGTRCCSYYPTSSESVRMMLRHCRGYASLYWRAAGDDGGGGPYDEVAEYGVRVDFEIPVTTRCRQCRERGGGGVCGFDTQTRGFLCLCEEGNVTTYCGDGSSRHRTSVGVIAGTMTVVSAAGSVGAGALIWYLRKMRTSKVTCGVQTNENRLF